MEIKPEEAAWMAGLFDGEGCVDFRRGSKQYLALRLRMGMTSFDAICRFSDLTDQEGIKTTWEEQFLASGKLMYVWCAASMESVRKTCELLIPYSIVKRPDMEAALAALDMFEQQGHAAALYYIRTNTQPRYRKA